HVEVDEAMELLAGGQRVGYLLKSRVTDVTDFIETVERITAGASVADPSLVQELVRAHRRRDPLDVLSPREREVLALMAEGASNAGIAQRIYITEGTVEKHVRSILTKLELRENFLLAAMRRRRIDGSLIACRCGAYWWMTTRPSSRRQAFSSSEKA